jgi:hypothetical protein
VVGLRDIWLNGQRLTVPDPARGRLEIPIDELSERNLLVLDAELLPGSPGDCDQSRSWGEIALVIRRESTA